MSCIFKKQVAVFAVFATLLTFLSCPLSAAELNIPSPDMTSKSGFDDTCKSLQHVKLTSRQEMHWLSKQQLQAWVICKDMALIKQTATWVFDLLNKNNFNDDTELNQLIKNQLDYMKFELSSSRFVLKELSKKALSKADALHLRPQTWQLDLNGNGVLDHWETRFFALPNRSNDTEFSLNMPGEASDSDNLQMNALIITDRTDVLWALSYHEFIEGIVELGRSQRINTTVFSRGSVSLEKMLTLSDKNAWRRAHSLISNGLSTSLAMRQSALAETDNDHEWIPNPLQTDSAFPLLLDQADFDTWGQILSEVQSLWNGKTLLVLNQFA